MKRFFVLLCCDVVFICGGGGWDLRILFVSRVVDVAFSFIFSMGKCNIITDLNGLDWHLIFVRGVMLKECGCACGVVRDLGEVRSISYEM